MILPNQSIEIIASSLNLISNVGITTNMRYMWTIFGIGFLLTVLDSGATEESADSGTAIVRQVLREKERLRLSESPLPSFATNDLPALASLLPTRDAFIAYNAMIESDADASIPFFVQYLTNANHNAQKRILTLFSERVNDPIFPRESVHRLVRDGLMDGTICTCHGIYTLASFDDSEDIPVIRAQGGVDLKTVRWAAARLGDSECLVEVARRMIPPAVGSEEYEDLRAWQRYIAELGRARWITREELIPAVILSLEYREGRIMNSEFLFGSPSSLAISALKLTVPPSKQPAHPDNPDAWIEWWNKKYKKQKIPTNSSTLLGQRPSIRSESDSQAGHD